MLVKARKSLFAELGLMRQVLLGFALVNALLPILHRFGPALADPTARSPWDVVATLIAPVMAPLFAVVILFDYIMSRVRAADAVGDEQARFAAIARIELVVLVLTLVLWIPFFANLLL